MKDVVEDLKTMSIEDVCKKYDMSFSQLFGALKKRNHIRRSCKTEMTKYIYLRQNRYWVQKKHKGLIRNYGSYINLEDALKVKNELVALDWNADPNDYLGDKWIVRNKGEFMICRKNKVGKTIYYGSYHSLSMTRKVRDCLVRFNWDKDYLPLILEKLRGEMA